MSMILLSFILAPHLAVGIAYAVADMFSVPPATMISASPALIICAAIETVLNPEPQTLLIVIAGTSFGIPASKAACLATFCPSPPWRTHPYTTSSIVAGSIPALLIASLIVIAPKVLAAVFLRLPPKLPIGVLTALAITTSLIMNFLLESFIID